MQAWNKKPLGLLSLSAIAVFASLAYLLSVPHYNSNRQQPHSTSSSKHRPFKAPQPNVWVELDAVEAAQVYHFLRESPHGLPFLKEQTRSGKPLAVIGPIEVLRPNKSDVLDYLDNHGRTPDRWAQVQTLESSDDDAYLVNYMVGPLPTSNDTQILPLEYCHNSGRNYVHSPVSDVFELLDWALNIGEDVADITQDLLGATVNRKDPADPGALVVGSRPALIENGRIVHWLEFFRAGIPSDGRSLLPQGLYVKLETPSPDPSRWETSEWYYNDIIYPNISAFRQAWSSSDFQKLRLNLNGPWTDTEDFGSTVSERSKPAPLSIQPHGGRYSLDREQKYISWMGFTFYLMTSQSTALSLFDIRFNNERIIYHLGLQEALAHYAGSEPLQSGLEFLDSFFGMGVTMFSLVPGHDCPAYADYLDFSYRRGEHTFTNKNAICVFEYTSDAPLQRHTSATSVTVSRNTYLVVRSVSTVGNYDYTIDYIFYLDGSVEVKLRASGFIFGAFHPEAKASDLDDVSDLKERSNEYGYRIHDAVLTSLHDHVVSFRADLDVAGADNTLIRTSVEPLTKTYAWDKPEVAGARNTMHLTHHTVTHETGMDWPKNSAQMYLIQSNETNKWGEKRAYRILPGTGIGTPPHLAILNSTTLGKSAAWSSSDLWILRHHDTEPASAHHMNYLEPLDPLVDFELMVDGETIVDEDIVVYFNLGGHHVPNAQDIPNTLMHTSASSVIFSPFNFFDHDVSVHSRQGVRIDRRVEGERVGAEPDTDSGVRYFGGRYHEEVRVPKEHLNPDLSGYMRERNGEGGWDVVKNKVRGGLLGLFAGRDPDDGWLAW